MHAVLLLISLIATVQLVRALCGQKQQMRCSAVGIELLFSDFGRIWSRTVILKEQVRKIEFGAVSVSQYGAIRGLRLEVDGTLVKAVPGLDAVDAQLVLNELRRLGFEIVLDPAFPMMVEIDNSRRSSRWNHFLKG